MKEYKNGMTVRDLKALIKNWLEENFDTGEPTEVWIGTDVGTSNQVTAAFELNARENEDARQRWSDVILEPRERPPEKLGKEDCIRILEALKNYPIEYPAMPGMSPNALDALRNTAITHLSKLK